MANYKDMYCREAMFAQEKYGSKLADMDFKGAEGFENLMEKLAPFYSEKKESMFTVKGDILDLLSKMIFKKENIEELYYRLLIVTGCTEKGSYIEEPVFKIFFNSGGTENEIFIDSTTRLYKSWKDYVENNVLPAGFYHYPMSGKYEWDDMLGSFKLDGRISPASKKARKVLRALDITSTTTTIAQAGVGLLTLTASPSAVPVIVAAGVATVTASVYSITRCAHKLIDRTNHGQSIGLDDPKSIDEWMKIVNNVFWATSAAGGALKIARSGGAFLLRHGKVIKGLRSVSRLSRKIPIGKTACAIGELLRRRKKDLSEKEEKVGDLIFKLISLREVFELQNQFKKCVRIVEEEVSGDRI